MTQIFLINDSFPAQAALEPPSIFEFKHAQKIKNTPRSKSSTTFIHVRKIPCVNMCCFICHEFHTPDCNTVTATFDSSVGNSTT